jgi:hypothetical protein
VAGSGEPERRLTHLQPRRVVESGLRAHARGRTVTVVGPFYEFLTFAGRFAPRALLRRMMGRQLRPAHNTQHPRQMLRHHEARRQRRRPSTPVMAVHSASSPVFCQPWSNRLVSLGPSPPAARNGPPVPPVGG